MRTLLPIIIAITMAACAGEGTTTSPQGEGMTGLTGPEGPAGEQGPQGDIGPAGPAGQSGAKGDTGLNGVTGEQGPQGLQGNAGAQGQQGATGLTGATGPRGLAGAQGATGATGAQGIQGNPTALTIYDATGTPMGYPITIDDPQGGARVAIYAHRETPPADFPEGYIVVPETISSIFFTGSGCTGNAYADSRYIGRTYAALYKTQISDDWWEVTDVRPTTDTIRSMVFNGDCYVASTPAATLIRVQSTNWNLTLVKPFRAVAL